MGKGNIRNPLGSSFSIAWCGMKGPQPLCAQLLLGPRARAGAAEAGGAGAFPAVRDDAFQISDCKRAWVLHWC